MTKHEGRSDLLLVKEEIQDHLADLEESFWEFYSQWMAETLFNRMPGTLLNDDISIIIQDEIFSIVSIVSIDPDFVEKNLHKKLEKKQREMEAEYVEKISLLDILESKETKSPCYCYFATNKNKDIFFQKKEEYYPESEVVYQPITKSVDEPNLKQIKNQIKEKMDKNQIKEKYPNHDLRSRESARDIWQKEIANA